MTAPTTPSVATGITPSAALYAMRRDPLAFFTRLAREQGDVAHFKLGEAAQDVFLFNHPDYIREVLVAQDRNFTKWFAVDRIREVLGEGLFVSEGDFHVAQRRLAQPAFHRDSIGSYTGQMTALAARLRDRWRPGEVVDVCREMNWLAMMIVASTLFGADVESEAEEIRAALGEILDQFERSILPVADRVDFENSLGRLDSIVYRMIKERRADPAGRRDLLSVFLRAEDAEAPGRKMTDRQVRDEVMTIFLAGHETSANALAWTWYLLSQHAEVEGDFHAELDRVLANRLPGAHDANNLPFTSSVFAEALRLYPPVWAIGRRATCDCKVGPCLIPAAAVVIVSPYVTQRDERWFPNPEQFDPQRWTPQARASRPRFSYFPFSAGSRACLGESFAGTEGVLCLAVLGQKWRLRLIADKPVALQPQLTLRARHGIKMQVEPRA